MHGLARLIGFVIFLALASLAMRHTDKGDWDWFVFRLQQLPRLADRFP